MGERAAMRISFAGLVGWVVAAGVCAGGAGAYPTWKLGGRAALTAELTAGACVLAVMLVSGVLVVRVAWRGPGPAAYAFIVCGIARAVASVCLAAGVLAVRPMPVVTLMLWVAAFYASMLIGECLWLVRALQRDALRAALGEFRRAGGC